MDMRSITCEECGSSTKLSVALPGFVACPQCGRLFAPDIGKGKLTMDPRGKAVVVDPEEFEIEDSEEHFLETSFDPTLAIPDFAEAAIGWRVWAVAAKHRNATDDPKAWVLDPPVLMSATYREHFWVPRQAMTAVCPKSTGRANGVIRGGHEVPDWNCKCGLYAAKSAEHMMGQPYYRNIINQGEIPVVGRMNLWGKVVEGSQGWRAASGYPSELYLPMLDWHLAEPLAQTYGVEVKLRNF